MFCTARLVGFGDAIWNVHVDGAPTVNEMGPAAAPCCWSCAVLAPEVHDCVTGGEVGGYAYEKTLELPTCVIVCEPVNPDSLGRVMLGTPQSVSELTVTENVIAGVVGVDWSSFPPVAVTVALPVDPPLQATFVVVVVVVSAAGCVIVTGTVIEHPLASVTVKV